MTKELNLAEIGSGSLVKMGRAPEGIRQGIADSIRAGDGFDAVLKAELTTKDSPLCYCGTPLLDEAEAEKQEGGGPIYDAVEWFKNQTQVEETVAV
jgi:hypothetical protein